ncbi:MAG: dihydroorotase [Gammaproteobacteria bacterium]|nr:dihydroorotase [Gammaproteobacteria bacterium]MYF68406.1 dihydroorotase [Gammaproteobacteria bacterium]MYK38167.1 dihydroorotase [Gammaproteobacteria bacterium]
MSSTVAQGRGDTLIRGATLINEGRRSEQDVLIRGDRIEQIGGSPRARGAVTEIDAGGKWLLPGLIDDQVHFREPGHVHKGNIASESSAAVAGGVTSFMDMPNVSPATVTRERLAAKYAAAKGRAWGNYAFYLGATESNLEEIQALKGSEACGVKVFMGPSTGDLLVEKPEALERIFANCPLLIATHCEDRTRIEEQLARAKETYGGEIPAAAHADIRDAECCYRSSSLAVSLARKHGAKLHVLHLTTAKELEQFDPEEDLRSAGSVTAEVCVHHLWFDQGDYERLGHRIKCNPSIKSATDRAALRQALADGRISVIATDHAPHTAQEKSGDYLSAPAGLPLVQHSLLMLLDLARAGHFTVERAVEAACHAPARLYGIADRGFLREGYFADCVLVDPQGGQQVDSKSLLYKCGWSPLEGHRFGARVDTTFVNGAVAWKDGKLSGAPSGQALVCNSGGKP